MAQSKKSATCPICKQPAVPKFQPFCSARCKMIDLGHWLKGKYVIPGTDGTAKDEEKKDEEKD
jgi:endogenous inhibitor of DNA gyrase (YacG/DUF329 family)